MSSLSRKSRRKTSPRRQSSQRARAADLPEPPDDLVKACIAKECVLYAGSGLSAQKGLPTWLPFVVGLLDWAVKAGYIKKDFAISLREAIHNGDTDPVADSIVSAVGSDLLPLHQYLKTTFLSPSLAIPRRHALLRSIPFCASLTTNFDNLLERTFQKDAGGRIFAPHDTNQLLTSMSSGEFFILKLYGTLERPETVLIAPAQYQAAVADNPVFSQFMQSLFFSKTLLFIGSSLDGVGAYLRGLKFSGTDAPRQHYLLIDVTGTAWKVKAELLQRRYGISVLPFTASPGYPEVVDFLRKLVTKVGHGTKRSFVSATGASPPPRPTSRLLRVQLENIGPFENQSFEFRRQWNVLLGDNGVGKSSILKAIALGICGEDAKPFAERLIKTGKPNGKITLDIVSEINGEVVTRTYVTKLLRTSTGAEVQTIPTRPLEAENLLSLGFPPLRAMSWDKAAETSNDKKERPDPTDLLPIISGDPDFRLDKLKNWILELDHLLKSEPGGAGGLSRYKQLLDKFFEVIARLTPGVDIKLKSIDVRGKRVMVRTHDGIVPLEYVSQGTSSLIGWIGVLLRRLDDMYGQQYSFYGEQYDPLIQHAIVLIDEIDAHMHPEWQQHIAPSIRELFPNLQIVATTHSPLIVPSLEPNEIIRLQRSADNKQITVEVPNYNVQDYRADQILTSPLFGLPSSLSPDKQKKAGRYTELAARNKLSPDDQKELEVLAYELEVKLPSLPERAEARVAYNLIRRAVGKQLDELPAKKRRDIADEMKVQLQELITGSRRP